MTVDLQGGVHKNKHCWGTQQAQLVDRHMPDNKPHVLHYNCNSTNQISCVAAASS